jgi:hypothetical protein
VSRRKSPQPSIYVMAFNAYVVCTDRGQHPQAVIARLVDDPTASLPGRRRTIWQDTPRGNLLSGRHAPQSPDTFRFWCRRCERDVRLRTPNVLAALDALRQVQEGRLSLDISLL